MSEYQWKTVSVVGFDELMRALDYADRKGFMPDAIKEEWEAFNWKPEQPAQDEHVQDQDIEDTIESAYWHFDARKKGLNEWAYAPQSERDAFKAEARKLAKGYFPTRQAQEKPCPYVVSTREGTHHCSLSAREPLTDEQSADIVREAHIAFCLDKYSTYEEALIRKTEAAHGIGGKQ